MNRYKRVGIGLLLLASVCLIGAAVYVEHALRNPEGITYYPNIAFIVRPAIGPLPIAAFVVFEHLLIASGIWSLCKGISSRRESRLETRNEGQVSGS